MVTGPGFIAGCDKRGLNCPHDITRPILERCRQRLVHCHKHDAHALAIVSRTTHIVQLPVFFGRLVRERHARHNPVAQLDPPPPGHRLPKPVVGIGGIGRVRTFTRRLATRYRDSPTPEEAVRPPRACLERRYWPDRGRPARRH